MRDIDLYKRILGLSAPWEVTEIDLDRSTCQVVVHVSHASKAPLRCPHCGHESPCHDHRVRRWRHLDTCQYMTFLEASVPCLRCPHHGVVTVQVPWADADAGFTQLFESLVIDWLKDTRISALAKHLRLKWGVVDRIMQRAVSRSLARRKVVAPKRLCVDETSFRKGHDYVTVVTDPDTHQVLHVSEERKTESLSSFYSQLSPESLAAIEGVSMDMWPAYIQSPRAYVPYADEKIAFDRFHIAKVLSDALDKVRRQEHKELRAQGNEILKGTRYIWLTSEPKMSSKQREHFESLRDATLKTAEAWAIKDMAAQLWDARGGRDWVNKVWQDWLEWAQACAHWNPYAKRPKPSKNTSGALLMPLCWGKATGMQKA